MKEIVPDYYPEFKCKCGDCRSCCCIGWGITLSYEEYCRLIGLTCGKSLRKRLDCAFFILPNPSKERYAEMKQTYRGDCPLRNENGLCALQCECGEGVLPAICKLYPRNVTYAALSEGACACSCERVAEMLYDVTTPLGITVAETGVNAVKIPITDAVVFKNVATQYEAVAILEDRSFSLPERILKLGEYLTGAVPPIGNVSGDTINALKELVSELEKFSPSFYEYATEAEKLLRERENAEERYNTARATFTKNYPHAESFFERVMVNHIMYIRFPFSQKGESMFDIYAELCGIYAVTRFVCVAYTEALGAKESLIDCVAGLFRCFEHSNADEVIKSVLKRLGKLSLPYLKTLVEEV